MAIDPRRWQGGIRPRGRLTARREGGETGRHAELINLAKDLWLFLTQDAPTTGLAWLEPIVDRGELEDPQLRYDALWGLGENNHRKKR